MLIFVFDPLIPSFSRREKAPIYESPEIVRVRRLTMQQASGTMNIISLHTTRSATPTTPALAKPLSSSPPRRGRAPMRSIGSDPNDTYLTPRWRTGAAAANINLMRKCPV